MKKLVTVTNKDILKRLNNEDITLVYPLKDYAIGYEEYFDIENIDDFVLINRILNDEEINKLKIILSKSKIKGIIFDDIGISKILNNLDIVKILYLDHLALNYESINAYLEYVDSVVVSSDLAKNEIEEILTKANKPLVVKVFELKSLMYSRRLLLSNYSEYHQIENKDKITASIDNKYFKIIESKYGTKIYAYPYYNALELLNKDNVYFYWYDLILMDSEKIINLVLNNDVSNIEYKKIFLDKETIYKVGELDG